MIGRRADEAMAACLAGRCRRASGTARTSPANAASPASRGRCRRRSLQQRAPPRRPRPSRAYRRGGASGSAPVDVAPDAAHQAEAVAADAPRRRLVAIGRADPARAAATIAASRSSASAIAQLAPSLTAARASDRRTPRSLPGMCGKPRKLTALANLSRQVAKRFVAAGRDRERVAGARREPRLPAQRHQRCPASASASAMRRAAGRHWRPW